MSEHSEERLGENQKSLGNPGNSNKSESPFEVLALAQPHDRFARKALGDSLIAADLLRCYADPVIARHPDLDHLRPDSTQFFGRIFREVVLDVPYISRLRDDSGEAEVLEAVS